MRLPTRSAILFAKHWFLEIDGYAVEYVRDGEALGGPRSLHDTIAFCMGVVSQKDVLAILK
jgi:hypothetical protein